MLVIVLLGLLSLLDHARAQSKGILVVTVKPECYDQCKQDVNDSPLFSERVEECSSPPYPGTSSGTDALEKWSTKALSYSRCACDIPRYTLSQACCVVDSCWGDDAYFPFNCGSASVYVRCGRGRDDATFSTSTESSLSPSAVFSPVPTANPTSTTAGGPSSGQTATGPDETGVPDEFGNDSSSDGDSSNAMAIGLGVGLGLGIPLLLIGAGVLGFCVWRTRRQQAKDQYSQPPLPDQQTPNQWASPSTFVSGFGTENKHMSELSGGEQMSQRYELSPDSNRTSEMP